MTTATAPEVKAEPIDRDSAIARIKAALKARSGKVWSVTGGKGTAWGWIRIDAPPAERIYDFENGTEEYGKYGCMPAARRAELATLLGIEVVHGQGVSIPAGSDYRQEFVDRAEGRAPSVTGQRYWD